MVKGGLEVLALLFQQGAGEGSLQRVDASAGEGLGGDGVFSGQAV